MRSRRNFITPSLFYLGVSGLIAITLLRLITSFMANPIIDYICYLDCTMALLKGLDCYEISNLFLHEWDGPLIIYPGMTLYFIPWTFISVKISSVIYYALTISVTVVNFVLIFKITGLLRQIKFKHPDKYTCLFFLSGFLFINSSPVIMCLRHGQSPTWTILGILLFFCFTKPHSKTLMLGLVALMKYSMITTFAPLLFAKRYYSICIAAFAIFSFLSFYLVFCGFDPLVYYIHYVNVLMKSIDNGYNSFNVSGYNMLQIDFFRIDCLNWICKLLLIALALYIFFIERRRDGIGLNLLLLIFCISMLISYHRLYDAGIIILLLLVKINFLFRRKDWIHFAGCAFFGLLYLVPLDVMFKISNYLGAYPVVSRIFHTCSFKGQYLHLLPLPSWSIIALACYAFYLYKKTDDDFIFDLNFKIKNRGAK
ncbi:MAG: glycosyltransferase 87 family protein [Lentisphaerota bacterium]